MSENEKKGESPSTRPKERTVEIAIPAGVPDPSQGWETWMRTKISEDERREHELAKAKIAHEAELEWKRIEDRAAARRHWTRVGIMAGGPILALVLLVLAILGGMNGIDIGASPAEK